MADDGMIDRTTLRRPDADVESLMRLLEKAEEIGQYIIRIRHGLFANTMLAAASVFILLIWPVAFTTFFPGVEFVEDSLNRWIVIILSGLFGFTAAGAAIRIVRLRPSLKREGSALSEVMSIIQEAAPHVDMTMLEKAELRIRLSRLPLV